MTAIDLDSAGQLTFGGGSLDRAAHLRDGDFAHMARTKPGSRAVLVGEGQSVAVDGVGAVARLPVPAGGDLVFLGLERGGEALFAGSDERALTPLRAAAADLRHDEAALGAYAVALINWHRTHRHCGRCGTLTDVEQAGHARRCPACGLQVFPRTDPAVSMVIESGDRCLLTRRQRAATATTWSALAGFVEPGETPEEAVAREALEEVGVEVHAVEYLISQPWPFPQALMIGFRAFTAAEPEAAKVHAPNELVDARWWSRAELRRALERREVSLPPPISLGHRLISGWLARDCEA